MLSALAITLGCALLGGGMAAAATHSLAPAREGRETVVFDLTEVQPGDIRAAYLVTRTHRRKLSTERVRAAAARGVLRLRRPRDRGRRSRTSRARSARRSGIRLLLVTADTPLASEPLTTRFTPVADTYVSSSDPDRSYGDAEGLRVDGSPRRNAYLRFAVSALGGAVTRATLRLYAHNSSTRGISLHRVSSNAWGEESTTFASAPGIGEAVSRSGSFSSDSYVSLDATSLVKGNGTVSMAVKTASPNSKTFDSREGANGPRLIVETRSNPTPLPLPGPTPIPPPPPPPAPVPPPAIDLQPSFPIRAAFYYPWFPETWGSGAPFTKYSPSLGFYRSDSPAVIQEHVRAMEHGRIAAAISSWWGRGHWTDTRLPTILATTSSMGSRLRWSLYYENESLGDPSVATIASDLAHIHDRYGSDPAYLRIGGRFVVFVYADGSDSCGMANRWKQAAAAVNAYVVLKVFSGYRSCGSQPDGWHQYGPASAEDGQSGYSYTISPGFHKADEPLPRLARDLARWRQSIRNMVASNAPFQLVTTFNEWGEGTAVESASQWASSSGNGDYLDALRDNGASSPQSSPPPPPPANLAPSASLTVSPNPVSVGQTVIFNGASSSDPDGSIASWRWDLDGDGMFETNTGSTATVSRSYAAARTVAIRLRVTDDQGATDDATASLTVQPPPPPPPGDAPVIAAAGDVSCDPLDGHFNGGNGTANACRQRDTSDLLVNAGLARVLVLGDVQYEDGQLGKYQLAYEPSWGRVKSITRPAIGNHEYGTSGAAGYFDYFNGPGNPVGAAGERGKGFYSFDVGSWHLIALNSNCSKVSCSAGSEQERWLRADLAAHPRTCTLAYWHHPRFSSGPHGNTSSVQTFWQGLYDAGADVVLSGHDHDYERFAPQDPVGRADPSRGIREFVVGTGGKNHYAFTTTQPNSEVRNSDTYGVLMLTLREGGYDWRFAPAAGGAFSDSGSGSCH